jgi:hypothetical protein
MCYSVPGFLAVVRALLPPSLPPSPLPSPSAICLSFSFFLCVASVAYRRRGGKGGKEQKKSYDGEKAWSSISINYSLVAEVKGESGMDLIFFLNRF